MTDSCRDENYYRFIYEVQNPDDSLSVVQVLGGAAANITEAMEKAMRAKAAVAELHGISDDLVITVDPVGCYVQRLVHAYAHLMDSAEDPNEGNGDTGHSA